jgi:hypothetical protein
VLDPDGITRTKTLGTDRMARKLADALPGRAEPPQSGRRGMSPPDVLPRLAMLHRDAFVFDERIREQRRVAADRGESDLADLDLGADAPAA